MKHKIKPHNNHTDANTLINHIAMSLATAEDPYIENISMI